MSPTALLPQVTPLFQIPKRPRALTPEQVIEIRNAHQDGVPVRVLAERFGIGKSVAHGVATGRLYTDVVSKPRTAWFDPVVRFRGYHSDEECRTMGGMLRQHPGKWALVKQNLTKPDIKHYESWGMEASAIQPAGRGTEWNLYVRWPVADTSTSLVG